MNDVEHDLAYPVTLDTAKIAVQVVREHPLTWFGEGGEDPLAYKTPQSVGFDLLACIDSTVTLSPGGTYKFPTGIRVAIPEGFAGFIFARSGLSTKHGIAPSNMVGVIDPDYRGEVIAGIRNYGRESYTVCPGDRIAQLVLLPAVQADLVTVETLDETMRGEGGFGHSGY